MTSGKSRRTVRPRHFIILPMVAMFAALVLSRIVESSFASGFDPSASDLFQAVRTLLISALMASTIGWLTFTYRRQYERELQAQYRKLKETRDFLSSIIDDSAEGIVTLDVEERVTSWNPAAERIFGWPSDEVLGRSVEMLLPEDQQTVEERRQIGKRVRAGETVRDQETVRVRKDGKPIVVRISWSPLRDQAARIVGTTGIVLDVTAEQQMRERLVARERLAAVGEMAAQVAHEIRNPLAGIRGACEQLFVQRSDKTDETDEIGVEVLHQIDRLNETITELLDFSSSRLLKTVSTDLQNLIDRVVAVFLEDPKLAELRIERHFTEDLPAVAIDPGQIEQVVYNLLLNSAQAMGSKGTIEIATSSDGETVMFSVRDGGPGFPEGRLESVFEPFFTTRTEGTGLGLSIVRKIVRSHGGVIEASNLTPRGAEVRVRLAIAG